MQIRFFQIKIMFSNTFLASMVKISQKGFYRVKVLNIMLKFGQHCSGGNGAMQGNKLYENIANGILETGC